MQNMKVLIAKNLLWGMGTIYLCALSIFFPNTDRALSFGWRTPSLKMHEGIILYVVVFLEVQRAKERRKGSLWPVGLMNSCAGFPMYRWPLAGHILH